MSNSSMIYDCSRTRGADNSVDLVSLRNLSVRSPSYVASKRSGGKYETAYDVGEAVTRRNERDWTGRVFKTYYICCIKFDKKLKEIVYRIKPTKNSKDGTWISEKNIKKL